MSLKRLALTCCLICCLFALTLPILTTYFALPDFGLFKLGPFWLMIGNHFLLIPLIIITFFSSERTGMIFLLPLTTWFLMLSNFIIFMGLEGLGHTMTYRRQCELSSYFLFLSIIAIISIYLKLNRSLKNENSDQ